VGSEAELAAVLAKAGPAHHQAFNATDGDDPEWPLWYADHIVEAVRRITGNPGVTVSELVYLLIDSDRTFKSSGSSRKWFDFYAHRMNESLTIG
jgi:hypothetical protein